MEYVYVTDTDIEISRVGLGTWAMGGWMWGGTEKNDSIDAILTAIDRGITLIDTAPIYGFGHAEEIVGTALENIHRENIVIATKVGLEWKDGIPYRNSTRERIMQEIDDSLKRLKTDYIDIYQVHWPDPLVPIEETAAVMRELLEAKTIKAIGVSNYTPKQMDTFRKEAPLHTCQPPYNLFERDIEKDILPYCLDNAITTITYGGICRGLLSGKMTSDRQFDGDDLRNQDPKFKEPWFSKYLEAAGRINDLAEKNYGKKVIHLAMRWIMQVGVDAPLWGIRRPDQLDPVDEMTEWDISPEDMEAIENILEESITDEPGVAFKGPPSRK